MFAAGCSKTVFVGARTLCEAVLASASSSFVVAANSCSFPAADNLQLTGLSSAMKVDDFDQVPAVSGLGFRSGFVPPEALEGRHDGKKARGYFTRC